MFYDIGGFFFCVNRVSFFCSRLLLDGPSSEAGSTLFDFSLAVLYDRLVLVTLNMFFSLPAYTHRY